MRKRLIELIEFCNTIVMSRKRAENTRVNNHSSGDFFIGENMSGNTDQKTAEKENWSARSLRTKAFRIALEMIAVFGLPAVVALVAGDLLVDNGYSQWLTYLLLAVAFVFSWVVVFVRVRSFARQFETHQQENESENNNETNA